MTSEHVPHSILRRHICICDEANAMAAAVHTSVGLSTVGIHLPAQYTKGPHVTGMCTAATAERLNGHPLCRHLAARGLAVVVGLEQRARQAHVAQLHCLQSLCRHQHIAASR